MCLQTCESRPVSETIAAGCAKTAKLLFISVLLFVSWAVGYAIPRFLIKANDTAAVLVAGITCSAMIILVAVWLYKTEIATPTTLALITAEDLYIEASVLSDNDAGD